MRLQVLALAIVVAVFCGSAAPAPIRLALVIGNGAYDYSDPLPNAPRDAVKVAKELTRLGFTVEPGTVDLDQAHLRPTLDRFSARVRAAGPDVITFVYYAGHAAQDVYGINYLIPIDAKATTAEDLRRVAVPLQPLLQGMEDANNDVNILVLDACRDWFKRDRSRQPPKGLHDMGRRASVLIAYAVGPDQTADEGANLSSSPFSNRLIEALSRQYTDPVSLLFDDVQSRVYKDTDTAQAPLYINGLARAGRWSLANTAVTTVAAIERPKPGAQEISPFLRSLDKARLMKFTRGKESIVDVLLQRRDLLAQAEIDTPERLAYFLGTIGYETGGFRAYMENFAFYKAQSLRRIFPSRVTSDEIAAQYANRPEAIANLVYSKRFGNGDEASGDGWRYRGRGFFFITGRANYQLYGQLVGVDLVASPDLLNDPEIGLAVAGALWSKFQVNAAADRQDLTRVARAFGAPVGSLPARQTWVTQARAAVSAP